MSIKYEYIGDSGDGKGSMKSIIYYLFLLYINSRNVSRNINFLILDTDATDGIDSDNFLSFLEMCEKYMVSNCQVICTLRDDSKIIETDIEKWNVFTLSDADDGFLFKKNLVKNK